MAALEFFKRVFEQRPLYEQRVSNPRWALPTAVCDWADQQGMKILDGWTIQKTWPCTSVSFGPGMKLRISAGVAFGHTGVWHS